ncbi:MAG: UvrD-helicase domain-containing protein [Acidimicrobiia bacterium]
MGAAATTPHAAAGAAGDPRLTVIEASAGTGKTHQITELVVEHVTERGVPIDRILVVTFTKAATAELRDRIRRHLTDAAMGNDARAERARQAVTSFDLATITTIHGFCHQTLATLGLLDDVAGESISTDDGDLRSEIANDAVLREVAARSSSSRLIELFAPAGGEPITDEHELRDIVKLMLTHITADVRTAAGSGSGNGKPPVADDLLDAWRDLLVAVRDRVLERRIELGILTHDDVIRRARDAVTSHERHATALRERYQLVLIDEFQDTDALQWEMFTAAFLANGAAPVEMVVVGDPKQAIYAFRGADVHAYLAARVRAGHTRSLEHSWRMERGLISAVNVLFSGAEFGEQRIEHRELSPPPDLSYVGPTMTGDPLRAPLSVRVVEPTEIKSKPSSSYVKADIGKRLVADDVAGVVRELLASDAVITPPTGAARRLQPSDIAVLVGRHDEATLVAASLSRQGLRCVQRGSASVAISPAAQHWRWLFHAMDRPSSPSAASLAALSWFIGWTPQELADASDARLVMVQERLAGWRRVLADAGIAALLATVRASTELASRLLARPDGERSLTDLEHLAELLHAALPGGTTPAALADALDALDPEDEQAAEHAARRIDSDDDAVQVLTIHTSKGLEFPVTLVPFLWAGKQPTKGRMLHDAGALVLDATIGLRAAALVQCADDEALGAEQRVLYVALTRARHRTVVWWGNAHNGPRRPLTDVLLRRSVDASCLDVANDSPKGDTTEVLRRLDVLARKSGGAISVSPAVTVRRFDPWIPPMPEQLDVSTFSRHLDRAWRRHSFSAIAAPAKSGGSAADHVAELVPADDELVVGGRHAGELAVGSVLVGIVDQAAPLAELALGGTEFGTAFHSLMETIDFAATDLHGEIERGLDEVWPWRTFAVPRALLIGAVASVLESPTGRCFQHTPLVRLGPADRLDELTFELPMATSGRAHTARDIGALMLDHLADDDPFRAYAQHLQSDVFDVQLAGYLTGSIDLVARVRSDDGLGVRFAICDYKTNRLEVPAGGSPLDAYHPDRLPAAMTHHHYPLQALLYSAALHRFLRWRLRGYEPARHLAGAAYLFVRGMVGTGTPVVDSRPFGVCGWDIPASLTVALSDLLDGRRR